MFLEFGVDSLDLDLLTVILSLKTCSSAMGSLESLESTGGLPHLLRRLVDGTCFPRARKFMCSTGTWSFRQHLPPLSGPNPGGSGWFHCFLLLRGRPWAARGSYTPPRRAPTLPPPNLLLLFLCLFYWAFLLYSSPLFIHVLVFGSLWLNILVKSPFLVTLAMWHPCLEPMGPHFRKYCPCVLTFVVYILGCLGSSVFVLLISCCNRSLLYIYIYFLKEKKNPHKYNIFYKS